MTHKHGTPNCKPQVATDLIEKNKMTDIKKWKAFFNSFNINYEEREWDNDLTIETDNGEGYSGFTFCAIFNRDGSFKSYGVWE